jgi:hypothetical protein
MALKHVIVKYIQQEYFAISDGSLFRNSIFNYSNQIWIIKPTITGPSDTYSEANLNTNFRTVTPDDISLSTASDFALSAWTTAGWSSTLATWKSEIETWVKANAPSDWNTAYVVYSNILISGTYYRVALMYKGSLELTATLGSGYAITGYNDGSEIYFQTNMCTDKDNDKIVLVFGDGLAVVGSVSGTAITWGTPVQFEAGAVNQQCAFDEATGKVVIIYNDSTGQQGKAIIGTISGTSISFGSAATFHNDASTTEIFNSPIYDPDSGRTVFFYTADVSSVGQLYLCICDISGTSVSVDVTNIDSNVTNTLYNLLSCHDSHLRNLTVAYTASSLKYARAYRITGASSFETRSNKTNIPPGNFVFEYDKHNQAILSGDNSKDFIKGSNSGSSNLTFEQIELLYFNTCIYIEGIRAYCVSQISGSDLEIYPVGINSFGNIDLGTMTSVSIGASLVNHMLSKFKDNKAIVFNLRNSPTYTDDIIAYVVTLS